MRKFAGMIAIILCCSLLLQGCGKETTSEIGTKENAEENVIEVWAKLDPVHSMSLSNLSELAMYEEMEKETGIKVKFIHPPVGQESEQYNLMVASRDFPDIIERGWYSDAGGPEKAIQDKIIIPLNDLIENHSPNYKKILDENPSVKKAFQTDEGKIFSYGGINLKPDLKAGGYFVREDWLEELNLSAPQSIQEWENMLKIFKEEKGCESPFTTDSYRVTTYMLFSEAYGIGNGFYLDANGNVKYGPAQPEFEEYLAMMNRWFEEGYVDNGMFSNDAKVSEAKVLNSQAGAFYGFIGGTIGKMLDAKKGSQFDVVAINTPALKTDEKSTPYMTMLKPERDESGNVKMIAPILTSTAAITTANENPEKSAKWLDFLYSEKGKMFKNFGTENVTYTMENGVPKYTDEILNNPDGLAVANAMGKYFRASYPNPGFGNDANYLFQYYKYPQQVEAMNIFAKDVENAIAFDLPPVTPSTDEVKEVSNILSTIKTYQQEMFTKFVMGTESLDHFDKYIETLNGMKLPRVIEIYEKALERYNSR